MDRDTHTPENNHEAASDSTLRKNLGKGINQGKKAIHQGVRAGTWVSNIPFIAHLLRTATRFNDRMGSQFGAAITYFSFLSMIPILMVSFAAAGYALAFNPELLTKLIRGVADSISDPTLAATIERSIDTAIRQRTTVGLTGLALALYSGVNWVGNLRMAIRAQYHDQWVPDVEIKENIILRYLQDFLALIGLLVALVITLSLTSIAGAAQARIVAFLGLDSIEWLRPAWTTIGLTISVFANYLLFTWILWFLPRMQLSRKSLLKGTFLAAVSFEILKIAMTWLLPNMTASPSGAAFGSVIGLMAFFYFFARLTLLAAAWIATDEQESKTA